MILVLGLLVGAVAWTSVSAPAQSYSRQTRPITEYDLKVAYVYNFARYFTWPKEAFADARAPFVIGVLGDDPLGRGLDDVARRKTVRGRRIEIRRFKAWKDYKTCQILFGPRTLERDILAEAVKCHFCGERTDRAPDAPDRRPFNPFSMFSPLLVISSTVFSAAAFMLTWNVAAALMVGGIVCGLGVALGIAGIVFAIRRRTRGIVGGTTGIVFGVIGICVTIASLVATDYLADALGDFAPELAGVLNPSGAGGDSVLMMCAECGYSEQMAAKDIVKHRLKSAQTMMGGAGDVEGLLDRVEKQGGMGMACPKCGKNQMFASVVCEYCQTAFVPGWRSGKDANYTETICPHCGKKQQDIGPMGFNSKALEGLINKGGGGDIEKLLNETGGGSK